MRKYLYFFSYQTPSQMELARNGFAEESSAAVFIEAHSPEQAGAWGREISERFVVHLFEGKSVSWRDLGFEAWIEADPKREFPSDVLERVPVVSCGTFPDFGRLQA
jgi:hypothetical protein